MRYFFPHSALSYPGVRAFSWNFSSPFSSWLAPSSRRKISRKTSGTRVASSIQTLQIVTEKFKSAGAFFSVACEQQSNFRSSLLKRRPEMRLLFAGYFFSFFSTLGARDFSSAVSGFCQVFIVTRAKIPTAREKNFWYPGYFFSQM